MVIGQGVENKLVKELTQFTGWLASHVYSTSHQSKPKEGLPLQR